MNTTPIPHEIALRIGLAARVLPDTDPARLLRVIDDAIGLPPTEERLAAMTVKDLKSAAEGEFADIGVQALKEALVFLKGETEMSVEPLPPLQSYQAGDMPDSIRVACGSNKGDLLDGHFGSCRRFLVYQVSANESRLIDIREVDRSLEADDKNGYRASLVADCQILLVASIGGPAAAKVVRVGTHPIKKPLMGPAAEEISALQQVIAAGAPPWLAKVMGHAAEERVRFEQTQAELEEA